MYCTFSPTKTKPKTQNTALLRVNKLFYEEGSPYLYINNTFSFGNGSFGSTSEVNLKGLKYFLQRVPEKHRHLIAHACIHVFLHKSLWHGTQAEGEQQRIAPTYNNFPDVKDAQKMVSKLMTSLPSLQVVTLQLHNACRSKKEPSTSVTQRPWDVSPSSPNYIGSTEILRTLMSYTRQNLAVIRLLRRQAHILRQAMIDLNEEFPEPADAMEQDDVPFDDLSPPSLLGAGTTFKICGKRCVEHEVANAAVDFSKECRFTYCEESLVDSIIVRPIPTS